MGNQQVSVLDLYVVPTLDGCYFSLDGKIYSTLRGKLKELKKIPHGGRTNKTYYRVSFKNKLWFIHRLVAAYIYGGIIPSNLHVNHIDGDTENNSLSNLEIVTHKENVAHAKKHGLYCSGYAWYKARSKFKSSTPETIPQGSR